MLGILEFAQNRTSLFSSRDNGKTRIMKEYKTDKQRAKFKEDFLDGYYKRKGKDDAIKMLHDIEGGSAYRADPFYYMDNLTKNDYYMLSIAEYMAAENVELAANTLTTKFIKRLNKASNFLGYGNIIDISEEELNDETREIIDVFVEGMFQPIYQNEDAREMIEESRKASRSLDKYYAKQMAKYMSIDVTIPEDDDEDKKAKKKDKKENKAKEAKKSEDAPKKVKEEKAKEAPKKTKEEKAKEIEEALKAYPNMRNQAKNRKASTPKSAAQVAATGAVQAAKTAEASKSDTPKAEDDGEPAQVK